MRQNVEKWEGAGLQKKQWEHCMDDAEWVIDKKANSLHGNDTGLGVPVSLCVKVQKWPTGIPCFIALCFTVLHRRCVVLFLQIESKILHQQKNSDSFYCHTRFIAIIWNWTTILLRNPCRYLRSLSPSTVYDSTTVGLNSFVHPSSLEIF